MSTLGKALVIYFSVSLALFAGLWAMNLRRRALFRSLFGRMATFEDLDVAQRQRWEQVHEMTFGGGFWRALSLVWMCFHYPGLIVSAIMRRNVLAGLLMFGVSAVVWGGLIVLIFR